MSWEILKGHAGAAKTRRIADLVADPAHLARMTVSAGDLTLDASKTAIDGPAWRALLAVAEGVPARRDAMFAGARINETEDRAVLHTALRAGGPVLLDGADVVAEVAATRARVAAFAEGVRSGAITGATGKRFTDVINIGIGGSDLGPAMAVAALAPYHDGPRVHFVSNIDGAHLADTLTGLDPETTLVVVASKTFTTIETMTNAASAKAWLGEGASAHLAAVSTALDKTAAFGVPEDRVFGFADWVGGRYSMWGPIGLPIVLAIGPARFDEMLAGARTMDRHFQEAPLAENLPVALALVGVWHATVLGYGSRAILPYDQRLLWLPAYFQQLDMESNGKSVSLRGEAVARATGPVVWGMPGTNGQHAFYQLIHQGTQVIPCEFLVAAEGHEPALAHHHRILVANCLAQAEALMLGRDLDAARATVADRYEGAELERQAAHRVFPGNRPSLVLTYPKLTPGVLGQIVALWEHRVFAEGTIWGINSFDQWGVELGKVLAKELEPMLAAGSAAGRDASTAALVARLAR